MFMDRCVSEQVYVSVCVCLCMHGCLCVSVCTRRCVYGLFCMCAGVCVSAHGGAYIWIGVREQVCVNVCTWRCVCTDRCLCLCISVGMHVCTFFGCACQCLYECAIE